MYSHIMPLSAMCGQVLPRTAVHHTSMMYCHVLSYIMPLTVVYCHVLPYIAMHCRVLPYKDIMLRYCHVLPYNATVLPCPARYDATGVRQHAGRQASVLNMIIAELPSDHPVQVGTAGLYCWTSVLLTCTADVYCTVMPILSIRLLLDLYHSVSLCPTLLLSRQHP